MNGRVAEFVAPDPHDFPMHFFVLKSLVFHTPEKTVGLTMCNFVTEMEKVLIDYFVTISLVIKARATKDFIFKRKNPERKVFNSIKPKASTFLSIVRL